MVKQIKSSKVTRWTWAGDRFTRREPNETDAKHRKCMLLYPQARLYSTTKGEFISTDPLGYVDGPSLYRLYALINGVDPLGLAFCEVKANVDLCLKMKFLFDGRQPEEFKICNDALNDLLTGELEKKIKEKIEKLLRKLLPNNVDELVKLFKEARKILKRRNTVSLDSNLLQVQISSYYDAEYILRCCVGKFPNLRFKTIGPKSVELEGSPIPGFGLFYRPGGLDLWAMSANGKDSNFEVLIDDLTDLFSTAASIDIARLRGEAERLLRTEIAKKQKCCPRVSIFKLGGLGEDKIELEF